MNCLTSRVAAGLVLPIALLACLSSPARAALITYAFSGDLYDGLGEPPPYLSTVLPGVDSSRFSGTLTVDADMPILPAGVFPFTIALNVGGIPLVDWGPTTSDWLYLDKNGNNLNSTPGLGAQNGIGFTRGSDNSPTVAQQGVIGNPDAAVFFFQLEFISDNPLNIDGYGNPLSQLPLLTDSVFESGQFRFDYLGPYEDPFFGPGINWNRAFGQITSISLVPEPGTWTLAACGAMALLCLRRTEHRRVLLGRT